LTTPAARILPCSLAPAGERDLRLAGDELERRSHSLLVTRYFVRLFSPNPARQLSEVQTRAWFSERERIFNRYTLPSVVAQTKRNKTWLIFIEKSLAKLLPETLSEAQRPSFVQIVEVDSADESFSSFGNDIGNRINTSLDAMESAGIERPIVTVSRLDNDDALSHDFLETLARLSLSERARGHSERVVTFPHGVQYLESEMLSTCLFNNNHFLSSYHAARFKPETLHAISFNHTHLFTKAKDVLVVNTDMPMWVEVVHGNNVKNKFDSRLPLQHTDDFDARFGAAYPVANAVSSAIGLPVASVRPAPEAPASDDSAPAKVAGPLVDRDPSSRDNTTPSRELLTSPVGAARLIDYGRMLEVQSTSRAMKPNDFLLAYSRILVAEDVKTLLEIGVHQGGSLKFWRELYGPGLKLYGLDIKQECAAFAPKPADKVFIGSQIDADLLDSIDKDHGPFDVIIDDGSHQNPHMWATFNHLFKALRPGGIYIVEDMFTSYWERYGGGLRRPESFVERCKGYVDTIYGRFMGPAYAKHHKIKPSDVPSSGPVTEAIESIAFHRCGIVVVRKRADAKHA
jgi:predicted O-methyltransferase YrrM